MALGEPVANEHRFDSIDNGAHKDPDHHFPVPREFKQISRDAVERDAYGVGTMLMQQIRKERHAIKVDDKMVSFPLPVLGEPGRSNSLISLSTVGCRFAFSGECSFCDYGKSELKRGDVEKSLESQVAAAFALVNTENEPYKGGKGWINLTAIGSMFDPHEIPDHILEEVIDRVAGMVKSGDFPKGVEWTTESRLEFITEERLVKVRDLFARRGVTLGEDLILDVGYGLESTDPLIVHGAMFKKVGKPYTEMVALLNQYGFKATAHTLFKPPFLTERESVEDATETVKEAFDRKLCETMIVMTMNVRDATGVGELFEQKMYQPPSIWSVAEIMKRLGPDTCAKTHFFGFSVATEAAGKVQPKDAEERELMEMIMAFAGTREEWERIVAFLDSAQGDERQKWQAMMDHEPPETLQARIASGLDVMGKKYFGKGYHELAALGRDRQERLERYRALKVVQ